jgi:serine/threonine protein phosphatase PrpC
MDNTLYIEVVALCHRGCVRENNEDSIAIAGWVGEAGMSAPRRSRHELAQPLLFAVADGMGGHAGGEIASGYVTKRLAAGAVREDPSDIVAQLDDINRELYETMKTIPALRGMGTTVAGLVLTPRRAIWFNVGDSRIYRQRNGLLDRLSIDDVPPGPRSGIITQTLGGAPSMTPISPHIGEEDLAVPCRWMLCSDGLTDMLTDVEIERAMAAGDEEAVSNLFAAAMQAGGADNISIVMISAAFA